MAYPRRAAAGNVVMTSSRGCGISRRPLHAHDDRGIGDRGRPYAVGRRASMTMAEDQAAVIDLLASPAAHGGTPVERIDTHASVVFLAGDRAWKLKRAVQYDYMDFSTALRRRMCCEAEVRLNRLAAPTLY